jgi:hypothetical protein
MPCSLVSAQGITISDPADSGASSGASSSLSWFYEGYPYVHGIGIAPYSKYNPEKGFREAKAKAVEDLNAIMTSAHLESFHVTRSSIQRDFEFAINSYYDTTSAVAVDSAIQGRFAYYLVRADTIGQMLPDVVLEADQQASDWTGDYFNPLETDGYYIAAGMAERSNYVPYRSWTKAKMDALNKLAHYLSTTVQNRQQAYDDDYSSSYESITYLYSKAIFRRIFTVKRREKDGQNFVLIAVPKDHIYQYK